MRTQTKQVEFTQANVMTCQCLKCGVQTGSACATDKAEALKRATGVEIGSTREQPPRGGAYTQPQGVGSHGMQGPGRDIGGGGSQARGEGNLPSAADIPALYCSSGTASCGDLDFSRNCVCPTCGVWQEHDLGSLRYCKDGAATAIG